MRLSVDDFGTGYSSLTYLSRFPIDELKIDRTFVRGLPGERQNAAIVGAILVLGRELGMNVVAEGVETKEQLQFLAQRRCNEFQGYLCSRPAPAEQFAQLVRRSLPQAALAARPQRGHGGHGEKRRREAERSTEIARACRPQSTSCPRATCDRRRWQASLARLDRERDASGGVRGACVRQPHRSAHALSSARSLHCDVHEKHDATATSKESDNGTTDHALRRRRSVVRRCPGSRRAAGLSDPTLPGSRGRRPGGGRDRPGDGGARRLRQERSTAGAAQLGCRARGGGLREGARRVLRGAAGGRVESRLRAEEEGAHPGPVPEELRLAAGPGPGHHRSGSRRDAAAPGARVAAAGPARAGAGQRADESAHHPQSAQRRRGGEVPVRGRAGRREGGGEGGDHRSAARRGDRAVQLLQQDQDRHGRQRSSRTWSTPKCAPPMSSSWTA